MTDRRSRKEAREAGKRPVDRGFRWTCPYCGASRMNRSAREEGEEYAIAALRAHIQASAGDGHGPKNGFPTEFLALSEHVVEVGD